MRVFISYRRSDTGGRAGRLRDALAARFGERNVFHDVTALAPGAEFDEQIGATIAACDVVLVLIGQRWLDVSDPDGGRRLDAPDDYVRREVREALTRDKRIVPVLVEDVPLPAARELPEDIAPLVRRQASRLRDESWQEDVAALVRGLEPDPDGEQRRPWTAYVAVTILAIAGLVGLWIVVRGALDDDGDDADDADEAPECEPDDGTWVSVTAGVSSPADAAIDVVVEDEPAHLEPLSARYRPGGGGGSIIIVEMAVTSTAEPGSGSGIYVSEGMLDALLVDGIEAEQVVCKGVVGDAQTQPGRTAIGEFGFESPVDAAGATIELAITDGGVLPFGTG